MAELVVDLGEPDDATGSQVVAVERVDPRRPDRLNIDNALFNEALKRPADTGFGALAERSV
jgi:hypothetical protein